MRAQPLLVVRDVQASSRFYCRLLGCKSGHGGPEYDRLYDPRLHRTQWGTDGLLLQLHSWEDAHHHGHLGDRRRAVGNGVLVWFEVDDFDAAVARARSMRARVVRDVHQNPNAGHRELWIADPDGYTVVLASSDGYIDERDVRARRTAEPPKTTKPAKAAVPKKIAKVTMPAPRPHRSPESLAALERVRAICLALPGAQEKVSHGEPTWFAGKVFGMFADHHHGSPHLALWVPAEPGVQEELIAADPARYFRPPYVGVHGWVGIVLDGRPPWRTVAELVEDGFRRVARRTLVAELEARGAGRRSRP